jgi:hypothetical protein
MAEPTHDVPCRRGGSEGWLDRLDRMLSSRLRAWLGEAGGEADRDAAFERQANARLWMWAHPF